MCKIFLMFFQWLYNQVSSDFYANLLSTIELVIAVVTIIVGGKKVNEWLEEYKKKRVNATFGFYVNLQYFIKRIRPLISSDDENPLNTLLLLSPDKDLRERAHKNLGIKLSRVASECLQYLSSKSDQIPPAKNIDERKEWKEKIDAFVDHLNQFYLINTGVYLPELIDDEGFNKYHKEVIEVLDYIDRKIEEETTNIFNNMDE